jgi:hypothetical protein
MQSMIAWTALRFAEGQPVTTAIVSIAGARRNDKGLDKIQEAWHCRDTGFNAVFLTDEVVCIKKQGIA